MSGEVGRVPSAPGSSEPSPDGLGPSGFDPSREQIDAWLAENCGLGIPYADATDLKTALHGLAYVLRQIESTNQYKVFIGQGGPATTALHWTLDHLARQAIEPVPADVARLVVAAREVAFSGLFEVATFNDPDALAAMRELDQASEAFASRVPWDDEPCDSDGSPKGGDGEAGSVRSTTARAEGIAQPSIEGSGQ